jgi:hypothetical protein
LNLISLFNFDNFNQCIQSFEIYEDKELKIPLADSRMQLTSNNLVIKTDQQYERSVFIKAKPTIDSSCHWGSVEALISVCAEE